MALPCCLASLDIEVAGIASGTRVTQYPYNGTEAQRFSLTATAGDCFKLIPQNASDKVFTEQDIHLSGAQSCRLTPRLDTGATNQQFRFNLYADGSHWIGSKRRSAQRVEIVQESYLDNADGTTTGLVAGMKNGIDSEIAYTYDVLGNITEIRSGTVLEKSYTYDALNRLIRENDADAGATYVYAYDAGGNITSETTYAYTTGTPGSARKTVLYSYAASGWKDRLLTMRTYDGIASSSTLADTRSFSYDAVGNPTSYGGRAMTWRYGRSLSSVAVTGGTATYTYNDDGIRTSKTVGGVKTDYVTTGPKVLRQTTAGAVIDFFYDAAGDAFGLRYEGTEYLYVRNAQGDVIGIADMAGTRVVTYTYDAWGSPVSVTGTLAATLGEDNPLRYRGYHYDTETGFYYLESRYYDPSTGRFINADGEADLSAGLLGNNMFLYCGNNPVNYHDPTGRFMSKIVNAIKGILKNTLQDMFNAVVNAAAGQTAKNTGNHTVPYEIVETVKVGDKGTTTAFQMIADEVAKHDYTFGLSFGAGPPGKVSPSVQFGLGSTGSLESGRKNYVYVGGSVGKYVLVTPITMSLDFSVKEARSETYITPGWNLETGFDFFAGSTDRTLFSTNIGGSVSLNYYWMWDRE